MNRKIKLFSLSAIALGMISSGVFATPILVDSEDGDNTAFSDWVISAFGGGGALGSESGDNGGGVSLGGQNAIRIDADTVDATVYTDVLTTDAFAGDMTSYGANNTEIAGMRFDFYAGGEGVGQPDGAPSSLSFYFVSDFGGSDSTWLYSVPTTAIVDGWGTYSANFGTGTGWTDLAFTGTSFANALTQVTDIGIALTYLGSTAGQVYGLDNFGLTVPEPETYLILGMALLSIAMVFRKKITESLVEARAMLQM